MTAPLHPKGTLRARFEPVASGDLFRKLGVGARTCDLGDEGLYLAEELVAADAGWLGASEHPEALAIMILALMVAQRQGSTRLALGPKGPLKTLVNDIVKMSRVEIDVPKVLKTIANLTSTPRFNSVIGNGNARLPLIVDDNSLYTERSRWLEQRVAERLAQRIAQPPRDATKALAMLDAANISAESNAVDAATNASPNNASPNDASAPKRLTDEQRRAVEVALTGSLAVITGGPGTGKTLVAASIVRGLRAQGIGPIALAAQTGKAANRLTEVIATELLRGTSSGNTNSGNTSSGNAKSGNANSGNATSTDLPPVAQTLHRLLGYGGRRFAHHAQSPLPVGAVVVDEASMVDLELMDALLDALPLSAPLILIGDAHQLPAIDAGQILADLAGPASSSAHTKVAQRVAVLATSFRMNTSDPAGRAVYQFAQAVQAGEPDLKLLTARTAGTLTFSGAEWVDTGKAKRPHDLTLQVAETTWHHFNGHRALQAAERVFRFIDGAIDPAHAADLEALWALLTSGRILTVTRALPTGAIAVNAHLHQLALERMTVPGRPEFLPGEPVMITANDYQRGLFNGDQGIIVRADEGLGKHHYRAVFRIAGQLRPFAIEALRDRLELAWALTVHKSQGSELDGVALLLPHEPMPLVTRELLYTGITRARRGVAVAGSRKVLLEGAKHGALRDTGLATRLLAKLRT
ncbi:MAG TPA: exodeoxyribonuclease V subunit alpha [Kofleriaceae bacterium]